MNKYNVPKKEYENVKQEMNSLSGEGDTGSDVKYYKVNDYEYLLYNNITSILYLYNNIFKVLDMSNSIYINGTIIAFNEISNPGSYVKKLLAFGFIPPKYVDGLITSLEDLFKIHSINFGVDLIPFLQYLTPITKEEFYDLNNI